MKTADGKCDDFSCPCRTEYGYCSLSACLKHSNVWEAYDTKTTSTGDFVEVGPMTELTDEGMKKYIQLYLKDHSVADLLKILADII